MTRLYCIINQITDTTIILSVLSFVVSRKSRTCFRVRDIRMNSFTTPTHQI